MVVKNRVGTKVVLLFVVALLISLEFVVSCNVETKKVEPDRGAGSSSPTNETDRQRVFFGSWKIVETIGHPRALPTMTGGAGGAPVIGAEITYGPNEIRTPWGNVEDPNYHHEQTWDEYEFGYFTRGPSLPWKEIGEYVNLNSMKVVPLITYNTIKPAAVYSWLDPGSLLIIAGRNTMITFWGVDVFLMKRVGQ